jgi:hypothetical protein
VTALTGPQRATRRIILQKARRHLPPEAPTACKHTVSGSVSLPSPGCFSPFPHGTAPLSVAARIQPWSVVAPASRRVARVRRYSGKRPTPRRADDYAAVTLSGAAFQSASSGASRACGGRAAPPGLSLQPHDRNGCLLGTVVVSAHPGSLATTTGMVSLPRGTEMFQFPRCPPPCGGVRQNGRVAPFGDRGISACTRLPHAYRSHAASFIGAQRRGILRVLIVSSLLERSTSSAFCIPAMMLLICTCQGTPPPGKSGGAPSPLKRAIRAVAGGIRG